MPDASKNSSKPEILAKVSSISPSRLSITVIPAKGLNCSPTIIVLSLKPFITGLSLSFTVNSTVKVASFSDESLTVNTTS